MHLKTYSSVVEISEHFIMTSRKFLPRLGIDNHVTLTFRFRYVACLDLTYQFNSKALLTRFLRKNIYDFIEGIWKGEAC